MTGFLGISPNQSRAQGGTGAGGGGRPLGALGGAGGPSMPGGGAGGGGPPFPAGPALPGALGGIIFWAARKGSCSE